MTSPTQKAHPAGEKVAVATLYRDHPEGPMFASWSGMMRHDAAGHGHWHGEQTVMASRIVENRSIICQQFLTSELLRSCTRLLMIDSDMSFDPDSICRMLDVCHNNADTQTGPEGTVRGGELKVLGGLCFAGGLTGNMYPTLYERTDSGPRPLCNLEAGDYPRDTLLQVYATGGAFLMVHRDVLTAMARPSPHGFGTEPQTGKPNPYPWFFDGVSGADGRAYGEDIVFCMRAQALGFGVYVHTGIKTGHVKQVELDEALWEDRKDLAAYRALYGPLRASTTSRQELVTNAAAGPSRAERRRAERAGART